jgi:hypothetical protein
VRIEPAPADFRFRHTWYTGKPEAYICSATRELRSDDLPLPGDGLPDSDTAKLLRQLLPEAVSLRSNVLQHSMPE